MIYIPLAKELIIPRTEAPTGWVQSMTAIAPLVWARLNTASGTEANLGSTGGNLSFGSSITRNATGGPVTGGGYASSAASSGQSYIQTPHSTGYTTFTVGGWIKLPASGNTQASHSATLFAKREYYASAANAFPFSVVWDEANGRIQVNLDSGNDYSTDQTINTANSSISTGTWHHLVVVVRPSGSAVEVYLNGSLLQSTNATTTVATASTVSSWGCAASNEYSGGTGLSECVGDWAEFFMVNSVLSATTISNLYASRVIP